MSVAIPPADTMSNDALESRSDVEKFPDTVPQPPTVMYDTKGDIQLETTVTRVTVLGADGGTLQNFKDGQRLLLPSPSDDPNDPLNWSQGYKWYLTCLVCLAVFCCNYITAGPSIAIVATAMEFHTPVPKTAYLFTTAALTQGLSMLVWSPIVAKFGRRSSYVLSFVLFTAFVFGAGACETWEAQMACRIIVAFCSGAGELLGPLTINDVFFVHERSLPLALYNAFLSIGAALALLINGWVAEKVGWRAQYWTSGALIAVVTLLVIFTFPETAYRRGAVRQVYVGDQRAIDHSKKQSWVASLRLFSSETYTKESWGMLIARPIILITYPAVLWNAFVFAATIGALVAVTSNVAIAYAITYGWSSGPTGTAFLSAIIGSLLGITGGTITDRISDKATQRNGGLREPEMRLRAFFPVLFTTPLALMLYGAGIGRAWHWMVPTVGLGLINFSIVWGTSISLVYMIDCLKPLAEEAVTSVLAFKAAIGFILSFYTNVWVAQEGYVNAFGEFAGITTAFLLFVFVFIFWGKKLRTKAAEWPQIRFIKWSQDRDDVVFED